MLEQFFTFCRGYLLIEVTGTSVERFLNLCKNKEIPLWGLKTIPYGCSMYISVKKFWKIKPLLKKTGSKLIIKGKYGFPFLLFQNRKRICFFAGCGISVMLISFFSFFIWNIQIDGNVRRTDDVLLKFLKQNNIVCGMRKSEVDCDRIVKDIRKEFDDIVWASAYLRGSRLVVHVKENTDEIPKEQKENTSGNNIIAPFDGVIMDMVTRTGTPCVQLGQQVKKGEVLVSGCVEIKNDDGTIIQEEQVVPDAALKIKTYMDYRNEKKWIYEKKIYKSRRQYGAVVGIFNQFFHIGKWNGRNKYAEQFTEVHPVKFRDTLVLPVTYGVRTTKQYCKKRQVYTKKEMQILLSEEFMQTCNEWKDKEIEVLDYDVKISFKKTIAIAAGRVEVSEMIGNF